MCVWLAGEFGLKPESEPGVSVQCRHTLLGCSRSPGKVGGCRSLLRHIPTIVKLSAPAGLESVFCQRNLRDEWSPLASKLIGRKRGMHNWTKVENCKEQREPERNSSVP